MDRRLLDRRRRVAEDRARSNLGRLVRVLALLGVVAVVVWFIQSPFVSVGEIVVRGADRVDPRPVLADHRVVEGRPLLFLDVSSAEAALEEDPWVASASVAREWPTRVVVDLEERTPEVLVELSDGRWLAASDAMLLEPADGDAGALPAVALPDLSEGAAADSLELEGAVRYVTSLPEPYRESAVVRMGSDGLEGEVGGHRVRIGRPFDTEEKALVTGAMLDAGVEEGAVLTVVAPASPAVLPPDASTTTTVPDTTTTAP